MVHAKAYVFTLAVFLALDMLWLRVIARDFYAAQLGALLRHRIDLVASAAFYLCYAAGIVFFAVAPALRAGAARRAAVNGALLGLLAYGTYDLTNIATLKDWPVLMSAVDVAWGGVVTGLSALAGAVLTRATS